MNKSNNNPHETRVVISGLGTINPIGNTVEEYWENLIKGKSGVRLIKNIDLNEYNVKIAGEIDLPDLSEYFKEKKMQRRLDRYVILANIAGYQVIEDAEIDIEKAPHRYGILLGTGDGGIKSHFDIAEKIINQGMQAASPFSVIAAIPSTGSGYFAQKWNLQGSCFTINSACASSNHAIGLAVSLIKMGMADAIFAGGSEAPVQNISIAGFGNMLALSERNDSPETASRPFDKDRDGFVLSEGAGMICLEELEHAKKREAHIYGEISGIGFSCDAHDLVAPHPGGRGATQAMETALKSAGLNPEEIDLINSHATSTPLGDIAECNAINNIFRDYAQKVPVQCTKSMVGHSLGAAGGIEAIAAILTLEKGIIHPTINQFEQDPKINLNVVKEPVEAKVDHILSNGFGFGGQNAVLVISRFKP